MRNFETIYRWWKQYRLINKLFFEQTQLSMCINIKCFIGNQNALNNMIYIRFGKAAIKYAILMVYLMFVNFIAIVVALQMKWLSITWIDYRYTSSNQQILLIIAAKTEVIFLIIDVVESKKNYLCVFCLCVFKHSCVFYRFSYFSSTENKIRSRLKISISTWNDWSFFTIFSLIASTISKIYYLMILRENPQFLW